MLRFIFFYLQKIKGSVIIMMLETLSLRGAFYKFPVESDPSAPCELICHAADLEMLFSVLSYYNSHDICNYTSSDLSPQPVVKSGAVKRPGGLRRG